MRIRDLVHVVGWSGRTLVTRQGMQVCHVLSFFLPLTANASVEVVCLSPPRRACMWIFVCRTPEKWTKFYDLVLIDVLETDAAGQQYSFLSIVCNGTLLHVVAMVRQGGGTPSSRKCEAKIWASCVVWAGWTVCVTFDQSILLRRCSRRHFAHGVYLRTAGKRRGCRSDRQVRAARCFKRTCPWSSPRAHYGKAALKMAAATWESVTSQRN